MKKWKDMSEAEKAKEREKIGRKLKRQDPDVKKSKAAQILAAHTDGRESEPDGPEMNAALWAFKQENLPSWITSRIEPNKIRFVDMDEYVIRRLIERDGVFFRKLADALDYLARVGAYVSENEVTIPFPYTVKSAILDHWEEWEKSGDKIERRLALLKEQGYKVSPQRYHKLVKEIGLK